MDCFYKALIDIYVRVRPKCSYINLSNLFKSTREDYIQKEVIKYNNLYKYDSLIYVVYLSEKWYYNPR